jgi:hypothetical protein
MMFCLIILLMKRSILISLILFINISFLRSEPVTEGVFDERIKSVQLYREGWKLSYPLIELHGDVGLVLSFDQLSGNVGNFVYRIIHCDSEWNESGLSENEYLEGFLQNQIRNYQFSFSTYTSYIHYTLNLPNEDVNFLISGNYLLEVYDDFTQEKLLFSRKFMVTEKLVGVNTVVRRPVLTAFRDNSHEISFSVQYGSFPVQDPFNDIKAVILQNGRWDNAIAGLKPLFDKNGLLEYDYHLENIFPAGHEFRWFDIKSTRYHSPYVRNVEFKDGLFNVYLFPEENRSGKQYFYNEDLNGKYYVEIQEEPNDDTDADYVLVHFELPDRYPARNGHFYIMGGLTNWQLDESSRMEWDEGSDSFKKTLLLKQGYYNYHIAWCDEASGKAELQMMEGNYYETENDYIVLLYHRGTSSRYDRLVGHQIANSVHQK